MSDFVRPRDGQKPLLMCPSCGASLESISVSYGPCEREKKGKALDAFVEMAAENLPSLEEAQEELRAAGIDPVEMARVMREKIEEALTKSKAAQEMQASRAHDLRVEIVRLKADLAKANGALHQHKAERNEARRELELTATPEAHARLCSALRLPESSMCSSGVVVAAAEKLSEERDAAREEIEGLRRSNGDFLKKITEHRDQAWRARDAAFAERDQLKAELEAVKAERERAGSRSSKEEKMQEQTTSRTESNQVEIEKTVREHVEAMFPALVSAISVRQSVRALQGKGDDTESFLRRALPGIVGAALATSYPEPKKKRSLARKMPESKPLARDVHRR